MQDPEQISETPSETTTITSSNSPNLDMKGIVGLRNLGNTCYANAAVQALRQLTELTYLCLAENSELQKKHTNASGTVFDAYVDLIKTMWSAYHPAFISPDAFRRDVLHAATTFGYDHFCDRTPQDAHEFLMFLLDQMFEATKETVNFVIQRPEAKNINEKRVRSALEAWKQHFEKQYTPLVDICYGLMEMETECQTCKTKTYRYETFNTLKVSMPSHLKDGKVPTLFDLLHDEMKEEMIEGYHCDTCSPQRTNAKRVPRIWRLPRCFILVLKRFTPDGRKIHTNWTCNDEPLNFKDYFSEASPERSKDFQYTLQSIVDHHGSSFGGHYTAQGKNPLNGKWFLYDAETAIAIEKPSTGPSSYILMFRAQS